jgi:hypothetical protein
MLRIDTERDQLHIGVPEWLLQFAHPAANHRARTGTRAVNEIRDPDFPEQLWRTEERSLLIDELKRWDEPILGERMAGESRDLGLTEKKETGCSKQRDEDKRSFPRQRAPG